MKINESRSEIVHPGAIFGNSFQRVRQSLLVVPAGNWTLFMDSGEGTPVETRAFSGEGAVRVEVDPRCAFAIRNDGVADLRVIVLEGGDASEPRVLIEPLARIAGVDGCRRGWIAMVKNGPSIEPRMCTSDEELVALFRDCAVVGIDIPIGLAERGPRSCDHHARRFLGRRSSSVFPAPLRSLLGVREYADANRMSRDLQKRGISKQGFAITRKVEQIDRILQRYRELRGRVYEVHPEVSFAMWNGGEALGASKHSKEGIAARRALVAAYFGEIPDVPRGASMDDMLDAFAALWTAERIQSGRAQTLGDSRADLTGLPMRIVF